MARMPSVSQNRFAQVPSAEIQRSSFDRSHGLKTTFDAGFLVPIFVDEVLPGDTFSCRMTAFGRMATLLHPIMDNVHFSTFFFAVPNRLLWTNWERFNGAQDNPADSTDYLVPTMTSPAGTGHLNGSLSDHFGIPTEVPGLEHVSLWHRAYNLIWNEWFRDQNLQDSLVVDVDDGPDDPADYVLKRRGKRHDYFTSSLPFTQKGDAVQLPLGENVPIEGIGVDGTVATGPYAVKETGGTATTNYANFWSGAQVFVEQDVNNLGYPGIYADLSAATSATINALRLAWQIQKLYERDARGGTRYVELIKAHFNVVSPDFRHQRPEFLGGGNQMISVNPIAQTAGTTDGSSLGVGELGAFATANVSGHGFNKSFTEHCVLIGLACIRADLTYQQGLDRMFSRSTRFDFFYPALAHIGEQEILNKEIYAQGSANPTEDADVFSYQERFAEYRYKPSKVTGQYRSNFATSLDTWHLSQEFTALPNFNSDFIEDDPPIDRVIGVPSEPHMLLDCWFQLRCARPMPVYGVPGMVDHF